MKSKYIWYAVAIALVSKSANCFFFNRIWQNSYKGCQNEHSIMKPSYNYRCDPLMSKTGSLHEISDEIIATIADRNKLRGSSALLSSRPGYTFGLGCDKWEASSYSGSTEGWNNEPMIRWVSRSLLEEIPYVQRAFDAEQGTKVPVDESAQPIQTRLDMHFSAGPMIDIPNMRISVTESMIGYNILIDYIPRSELLSSLDYFDKYFQDAENDLYALTAVLIADGVLKQNIPQSVLSKMLRSPFAISADLNPQGGVYVKALCIAYVSKWCSWLNDAAASTEAAVSEVVRTEETTEETADGANSSVGKVEDEVKLDKHLKLVAMYERDQCVQKLFFEEQKYELAKVMGPDFAPKAAELAAAIVGPSIGAASYILY